MINRWSERPDLSVTWSIRWTVLAQTNYSGITSTTVLKKKWIIRPWCPLKINSRRKATEFTLTLNENMRSDSEYRKEEFLLSDSGGANVSQSTTSNPSAEASSGAERRLNSSCAALLVSFPAGLWGFTLREGLPALKVHRRLCCNSFFHDMMENQSPQQQKTHKK